MHNLSATRCIRRKRGRSMRIEIEHVIEGIRERYEEPLSLHDLGEMARLTPFHMARVFREQTGLPPAQFLTAVRLEAAKQHLLRTDLSIADISLQVGYMSIGSFTTRFSKTFGVSPGQYRRMTELGPDAVEFAAGSADASYTYGSVRGRLHREDGLDHVPVFVAAFHAARSSGRPARCYRVVRSSDPWTIAHVPAGRWYVEAVSLSPSRKDSVVAGSMGPVDVTPGASIEVDMALVPSQRVRTADSERCSLAFALPELYAS
ncbi:helix-turn-helix domain-containing protein [Streptomyces sp. NPDC020141]|uniref:helix-turn-helix domain-containing protein n=1 Tax=Streptomyces sp. NPDC020141 TaxID=3365065 RepID=UPI0037B64C74